MKWIAAVALLASTLAGCNVYRDATSVRLDPAEGWRGTATAPDRERLRGWHKAWDEALPLARASHATALAADPLLFDPDTALGKAMPPPGTYRCRTFKLGGKGTAVPAFAASPWFECRVADEGDAQGFHQANGVQRPTGLLFPETDARAIFLGTLVLGDENAPLRYGLDGQRDMAGYVERIGERRWRLVLPYPSFESTLDIVELVPAS
jgi:hypothetical protein